MQITVECCGPARRWCGADELSLELPGAARVADVAAELAARYPEFAEHQASLAWAVGERVVPRDEALSDGTALAIIPPVSGG